MNAPLTHSEPATLPVTSFGGTYARLFRHPREVMLGLRAEEEKKLRWSLAAIAIPIVGYTVVYIGLSQSGAYPSTFHPWLAIEAEHYYRYNVFLLGPSILAGWLLASAVVQMVGRAAMRAKGAFEDTAMALAFAISAASWTLLPHDLVVGILGGLHVIDGRAHEHAMNAPTLARTILWTFMALYAIAFPFYFTKTLGGVHGLKGIRALVLGFVGFFVYQIVFLVFNR